MTKLVSLPLTNDLVDQYINLTSGVLIRRSDATYVNTSGALAYSRGTRTNLVLYSGAIDNGVWASITAGDGAVSTTGGPLVATTTSSGRAYRTQAITTVVGITYIFSAYVTAISGGEVNTSSLIYNNLGIAGTFSSATTSTTGRIWQAFTATGTATYIRIGLGCDATQTGAHSVTITNVQIEALPSGNVIGSDLMDQEVSTTKTAGFTLEVGGSPLKVYKIVSRATLDFTTVGAADNTAGTYFICHTAAVLGAGDSVLEVTSPAKGSFHGTAMLAGSTELVTNGGFETAGAGAPDLFGTWTETTGGSDTIADATGAGTFYLGAHAALLTYVDNGATYVANTITTTAGKLYKLEFYTMATAEDKAGRYSVYNLTGSADIVAATTTGVTANTYTKVTKYFYTPASCVSVSIRMWTPTEAGGAYYDYVSVRQVQTTWIRSVTNTLEIDETEGSGGALKISYVDGVNGARLDLGNIYDLSSDLTSNETYQITFKAKTTGTVPFSIVSPIDPYPTIATVSLASVASLTSYTLYFKAPHASATSFYIKTDTAGDIAWIDDLTIKSVPDLAYLSPGTYTATAGSTATIPAEPRFEANGLLVEGEGTNFVTYSCDFTNAAWVKTNITPLKNQTGPDGVASSASLLTAGAANGTALFTVADGGTATNKTFSMWIKRVTGTGNIDLTDNNGTNWTTQSVTSTWTKFTLAARSQAIPIVGIRIVANTDAVAVCLAQNEISAYATSGIYTNGCPVTRLTEAGSATNGYSWTMSTALKNKLSGNGLNPQGTLIIDWIPGYARSAVAVGSYGTVSVTNTNSSIFYHNADYLLTYDGAGSANTGYRVPDYTTNSIYTIATRWNSTVAAPTTGKMQLSFKSSGTWTHGTAANFDGAAPNDANDGYVLGTSLRLGYGNEYPFWIRNIRFVDYFALDAPAAFTFTDVVGAFLGTVYTSNTITPTSIDAVISIVGGTYSINGGAYTAAAGIIGPDDTVSVRVTSSAIPLTAVSAVLTMGAQSDTFTVTTMSVGAGFLQGMRMVLGGFAPSEKDN